MPSLGERLAVAYGWERDDPISDPWIDLSGGEISLVCTPDPENSWQDFGAMLEFATTQHGLRIEIQHRKQFGYVKVLGETVGGYYEPASTAQVDGNWSTIRCAVTKAVLEVLDA